MADMLQSDSVLRNIPKWLKPETRYFFEAIAMSIEMVGVAYARLRGLALKASEYEGAEIGWRMRAELFDAAWGFVGHVHMLNQFLSALPGRRPDPISEFLEHSKNVGNLRNRYQHLHQNIKNRTVKKGSVLPAVGALYWVFVKSTEPLRFVLHIHTSGMLREEWTRFESPNPVSQKLEYPAGAFRLEAFEEHLDLSQVYRDIERVISAFDEDIKPSIMKKIEEASIELGQDLSELQKSAGGPLDAVLNIDVEGYEIYQEGWVR
ncbi:MAG: hypothetical protein WEB57_13685 [Pseudohongiellaceae bacterium]